MDRACGEFSDVDVLKKPCSTLLEEMNDKVGEFDVYNIYDTCGHDRSGNRDKAKAGLKFLEIEETMASDTITIPAEHANTLAAKRHPQVIPTPSHLLGRISPISFRFPPVFCALSPPRRDGSNEPQAGTQGQETVSPGVRTPFCRPG